MTAQWNLAIRKAPPNNDTLIIARMTGKPYQVGTGKMLHQLFHMIWENKSRVDPTWMWTAYTDELWETLKPKS